MRIACDHPALDGHFPGQPVVPGVLLLELVIAELAGRFGNTLQVNGIPNIKFLAPLLPDREFEITFDRKRPDRVAFEVVAAGVGLATGTLDCVAITVPADPSV